MSTTYWKMLRWLHMGMNKTSVVFKEDHQNILQVVIDLEEQMARISKVGSPITVEMVQPIDEVFGTTSSWVRLPEGGEDQSFQLIMLRTTQKITSTILPQA